MELAGESGGEMLKEAAVFLPLHSGIVKPCPSVERLQPPGTKQATVRTEERILPRAGRHVGGEELGLLACTTQERRHAEEKVHDGLVLVPCWSED